MNLVNENISMDFILEMKEAFQLFDKVSVIKKIEIGNCNSYQKSKWVFYDMHFSLGKKSFQSILEGN